MRNALADARVEPEAIDYINAHGTSTPYNDKIETLAIRKVFGDHSSRIAVNSTKSMTGHLLGAAGGIEAAVTAFVLKNQIAPPTINYETPDPECDLDYVPNSARKMNVKYALTNSFGFGGTNATLLLTPVDSIRHRRTHPGEQQSKGEHQQDLEDQERAFSKQVVLDGRPRELKVIPL